MKKLGFYSFLLVAITLIFCTQDACAQTINQSNPGKTSKSGVGFRVGLNYAKVSGGSDSITYHYTPGLMVAVFLSPPRSGIVGYRSELLYSRQGFEYDNQKGTTGTVTNDYLMVPQMMTINITKFIQLQAGAFAGYLLHTKDSNAPEQSGGNDPSATALNIMNRFDYGAAAGIEVHPVKGLTLNARYNMGFAKLYKEQSDVAENNMNYMGLTPWGNIDTKNAVLQFSVGYIFR